MATDDTTADLPPRPDPETGQPVTPEAPTQTTEGYNEKKPSRVPDPRPWQRDLIPVEHGVRAANQGGPELLKDSLRA